MLNWGRVTASFQSSSLSFFSLYANSQYTVSITEYSVNAQPLNPNPASMDTLSIALSSST